MSVINILFLPMVFFIGLITSYEDIKYSRIRNKWIILGLSWGITILLLLFIWDFIASPVMRFYYFEIKGLPADSSAPVFTVHFLYLGRILLNAFIATIISFLMWRFNTWTAGDAKLFIVYALLLPPIYYWKSFLSFFPSFALLINIFIVVLLYLLISSLFFNIKSVFRPTSKDRLANQKKENKDYKQKSDFWKKLTNFKSSLNMLLGFLVIILLFGFFHGQIQKYVPFDVFSLQVVIFVILIILSTPLLKLFQRSLIPKITILALIFICAYGFIWDFRFTLRIIVQSLAITIVFTVVFMAIQKLIDIYLEKTEGKKIRIDNLRPGMILNQEALRSLNLAKINDLQPAGLTKEQVKVIKKQALKINTKEIIVYKPFPFAVWMFIGVIATLLLKGSMLNLLLDLIR